MWRRRRPRRHRTGGRRARRHGKRRTGGATGPAAPAVPAVSVAAGKWTRAAASRARMSVAASASRTAMSRIARRAAARAPCPTGGTATCDGMSCGGTCPSGTKILPAACVPQATSCGGDCPGGSHDCGGICQPNRAVSTCGVLLHCRARRPRTAPRPATARSADSPALPAITRAARSACPTADVASCGASCSPCAISHRRHGDVRRHVVRGHLPERDEAVSGQLHPDGTVVHGVVPRGNAQLQRPLSVEHQPQ